MCLSFDTSPLFFNSICSKHWLKILIFACLLRESDIYSNYFKYTNL